MTTDYRQTAQILAEEWDRLDEPREAMIEQADELRRQGAFVKAMESYSRAIRLLRPEDSHDRAIAKVGLGICCLLQEEANKAAVKEAEDNLTSALKILRGRDPYVEGLILLLLGTAYQARGTLASLEEALKTSIQAEKVLEGEELERKARERVQELNSLISSLREKPVPPGAEAQSASASEPLPDFPAPELVRIPILGKIGAGPLVLAGEYIEGYIPMDLGRAQNIDFALRVKGNSMAGAGIRDGDIVFVRSQSHADNGDIVVAMVSDQMEGFALKRYYYDGQRLHLWSEPVKGQREEYFSVDKEDAQKVQIVGKVITV